MEPKVDQPYRDLFEKLRQVVLPWRRLTIGVDGRDGTGKSTLARYLAFKLGMPALETDMFLIQLGPPAVYRTDDLGKVIEYRHQRNRPVLVEGVFLLSTLKKLGLAPDFFVYVESAESAGSRILAQAFEAYEAECRPKEMSQFLLRRPELSRTTHC